MLLACLPLAPGPIDKQIREYAEKISQPGEFLDLLDATMVGNVLDKENLEMFGLILVNLVGGLNLHTVCECK